MVVPQSAQLDIPYVHSIQEIEQHLVGLNKVAAIFALRLKIVGLILIDRRLQIFRECISMDLSNAARCCSDV